MVVYGTSGLAFAGANLLLARALSTDAFALVTLVVALATLGYHFAPVGLDAVVARGRIDVGPRLLVRVAAAAVTIGVLLSGAAMVAYELSTLTALLLLTVTTAGGLLLVAAGKFQREHRFGPALALLQAPNWLLLASAAVVLAVGARTALLPLLTLAIGLAFAATLGWVIVLRERRGAPQGTSRVPWNEALALAGVGSAVMLLIQLERLVIPHLLPLSDLALFGVLGAIAGSLFRVLQMGVGFSLLPRLRSAATVFERRQLVARELRLAAAIAAVGAIAVLVLTPLIESWFLDGKYHLPTSLVVAALLSGIAKIAHSFAKATVTALATPRELALVNGAGWMSVALAIGAAVVGSGWGLAGLVYGVGLGWAAWAALSFAVVVHHLRLPANVPADAQAHRIAEPGSAKRSRAFSRAPPI
jgi:hypothetical protein